MRRFSKYVSLLLLMATVASCSPRIHGGQPILPEIIMTSSTTQKFNLQLDFMKHHFSGLLAVRRMGDDEIRLLFGTYFGLSVFDFSLRGDSLHVNSCIEPMRKEKVLRMLEADFKQIFLPGRKVCMKEKNRIFEKRISGKGLAKAVISLSEFTDSQPGRIQVKHPWIRLKIQLDKLENE